MVAEARGASCCEDRNEEPACAGKGKGDAGGNETKESRREEDD